VAWVSSTLAIGDWKLDLSNVRSVLSVEVVASTGRHYLKRETVAELYSRLTGDDNEISVMTRGTPAYYALGVIRTGAPSAGAEEQKKRIIIAPPADAAHTIVVESLLESNELSGDASFSYWTLEHPDILVEATMYKLELSRRNMEGARGWLEGIELALQGIDKDSVSEQVSGITNMKDAW
jgi:hypothetical protein